MKKSLSLDRTLGMDRAITRRDFLNGVAIGTAALAAGPALADASPPPDAASPPAEAPAAGANPATAVSNQDAPGYYPPLLTGMRGSHPGSFEAAHALRDGQPVPSPVDTGEQYDLIIVGAGISGLAAAHFYRESAGRGSRILLLDNHDDFGGHAKRNEFDLDGHLHLLNGGTLEIDSPRPYGKVADGLLRTLGIDVEKLIKTTQHPSFYEHLGLKQGSFFDRETFGTDRLVIGMGGYRADKSALAQAVLQAPLSDRARKEILQLETAQIDYMPGLSSAQKKQRLSRMSYEAFLRDVVKVDPAVNQYYHAATMGEWGVGTDAVSALDCWGFDMAGFQGMRLAKGSIARMGPTPAGYEDTGGSYRLHFPDGNATVARSLVRDLLPQAFGGRAQANSVEKLVTARLDYSQLDRPSSPVRLRLSSTVVRARHLGDPSAAGQVEVTYVRGGSAYTARAGGVVLACYNMMIPYLCPELPQTQREALHRLVKTPLVYTSVALANWRAFDALKLHFVYAPGSYHSYFHLNPHVTVGGYRGPASPDEPILVHMVRTPCKPGLPEHEQNRAGRAELLAIRIAAEGEARPLFDDLPRAQIGVPGEAAEAVQVGLRHVIAEPVFVETHVGHADEAAGRAMKRLARHQRFHRRRSAARVHVEIERLFPHGHQKDRVPRLARYIPG